MTGFQRLCLVTCAVIFGLIVLGGVVRHTDSGLGCPDWPRCHGSFIPRWEIHTLIEYSHRLTASIAGVLVLGILVVAWRNYRRVPAILYPAILTFVLILVQAGLGGAAVVNELPPEIVAVHLSVALTILALLALITATSFALSSAPPRISIRSSFGRIATAAATTTLVLMVIGSYVSGAGYGLACSGWPLCNGEVFPSAHAASVQVHFLHRFVALILGVVLLALAWRGWRERESAPYVMTFAGFALLLYVAQALVGAANIWTQLSEGAGAAHLALATLLWLLLVVLNIRVHRLYDLLPHAQGAAARPDLLGAPR
jgi:cytochrome c oxidase assembly protein subunit 15